MRRLAEMGADHVVEDLANGEQQTRGRQIHCISRQLLSSKDLVG